MVLIVSGVVWTGVMVTKFAISKVFVWKALEHCIRPDENRELETGGDQDVPELGQAVHNDEEEEQQQPLVGATNRTLGILTRILSRVLNTGGMVPRTRRRRQGEGREPTLQSEDGYNSLDPWDSLARVARSQTICLLVMTITFEMLFLEIETRHKMCA